MFKHSVIICFIRNDYTLMQISSQPIMWHLMSASLNVMQHTSECGKM